MTEQITATKPRSVLFDRPESFGWISIFLHWTTAVLVIVLWFIGKSIMHQPTNLIDPRRGLHVTIALLAWLPLAVRILWRLRIRHPHVKGQSLLIHRVARSTHYAILGTLALMLLSGPLMVWSRAKTVLIFDTYRFPTAADAHVGLAEFAFSVHSTAAIVLFVLVLLHIGGALKHLMFHEDDTIVRILWPKRR